MTARVTRTRTVRIVGAAATAVLAAALLGGCGGFGGATSDVGGPRVARPSEIVQASFDKLRATGTAHVHSLSRSQVGQVQFDVNGDGSADFRQPAYDLDLTVPALGSAKALGIVDVIYVKSPQLSAFLPGNPTWVLIDPRTLESSPAAAGQETNPFVHFAATTGDAIPQLSLVKGAQADTRVVGPETIMGQPTTHYSANLEVALAKRLITDPQERTDLDRYTRTVHDATLPADIWIDGQGRLVQLRIVFSTVFRDRGTDSTLTFSQLGAPIPPIGPPPSDQVTDLATLPAG